MDSDQDFAAKISLALNAAAQCAAAETSDSFAVLGERLGELETLAKRSLQSHVAYQPLLTKLQDGTALTADELKTLRSLIVGDADRALRLSAALEVEGFLVVAIRPPTVPPGGARLRFAFSAAHAEADVDRLAASVLALLEAVA